MGWLDNFSDLFFGDVEAAEDDSYSIPEDDPFYIDFDTPDMIGDGSVYQGDDMGFDINDYIDLSTGIATDDPFHIDFSNIPDMLGDGSVYEGDDMDFSIFDLLDIPDKIGDGSVYDYDDPSELDWDSDNPLGLPETGPLGGGWWPAIRNTLIGSGGGPLGGNILGGGEGGAGILGAILGLGGQGGGGIFGGGGGEAGEGGLGSLMGGNPLLSFLAMKSLLKDEPSAEGTVPIGGEAYGGPAFNYQDYQPTNLTPALMPGVGYANMGPPSPPPPPEVPGMMYGGSTDPAKTTSFSQRIGGTVAEAIDNIAISPYLSQVGFFENPSFEKYTEGARLYNQNAKYGIDSAAPLASDSFGALRDGYQEMMRSFKQRRGSGQRRGSVPGMMHGGDVRPGDITFAKLEPGEFVIQKPAVDAVGIETLEQINNMGNGGAYYG